MTEPVTTASTASTFADIGTGLAGVSSLGSLFSGNDSNSTAMDMQRWDMAFQKDMRAWQYNFMRGERKAANRFSKMMSDTAVQRRMRDMKRAGINPILAAKYDASTPSGVFAGAPGGASAGGHGPMANKDLQRSQALAASASAMKGMAELRNIHAQTKNINADTAKKNAEKDRVDITIKILALTSEITDLLREVVGLAKDNNGKGAISNYQEAQRIREDVIELTPEAQKKAIEAQIDREFREAERKVPYLKGVKPEKRKHFGFGGKK
jgi:hypothetical protein